VSEMARSAPVRFTTMQEKPLPTADQSTDIVVPALVTIIRALCAAKVSAVAAAVITVGSARWT
jgi:hypothetical protein